MIDEERPFLGIGSMTDRLNYLREQHGAALLTAFLADGRNAPFVEEWLKAPDADDGRIDQTARADVVFARYRDADPTSNGSCTQWLIRLALAGDLPAEDLPKARETLEMFLAHKRRLEGPQRDLGRHRSLGALWTVLAPLAGVNEVSGKEEGRRERAAARAESEILLEHDGWIVAIPRTVRAAKWWGRGTRWCTAADQDDYFVHYNNQGPLVVFVRPDGGKFQFHAPSRQFMDAADNRTTIEAVGDIRPVLKQRFPGLAIAMGAVNRYRMESLSTKSPRPGAARRLIDAVTGARSAEQRAWLSAVRDFALDHVFVPKDLGNAEIRVAAVTRSGQSIVEFKKRHRTYPVCLAAVTNDGSMFRFVPERLRDRAIHLAAIRHHGSIHLNEVPKRYIDYELCLAAVTADGRRLDDVPDRYRDRTMYLAAVSQEGGMIRLVPPELIDKEIALAAVSNKAGALNVVPEHLHDHDLYLAATRQYCRMLTKIPEKHRNREICEIAVRFDGLLLNHVPMALRDESLCRIALEDDINALRFVPPAVISQSIAFETVTRLPSLIVYVPDTVLDRDLCRRMALKNTGVFPWLPADRIDAALAEEVVRKDPTQAGHVPDHAMTETIRDIVATKAPTQLVHLAPRWLTDEVLVKAAAAGSSFLQALPLHRRSLEVCIAALRADKDAMRHIPERMRVAASHAVAAARREQDSSSAQGVENGKQPNVQAADHDLDRDDDPTDAVEDFAGDWDDDEEADMVPTLL